MNDSALKSDLPKISAMIGVRMSATSALTRAVNAVPMMTAHREIDDVAAEQELLEVG